MMITKLKRLLAAFAVVAAFAAGTLLVAEASLADRIVLKDGRTFEGKVVREGKDFVQFRIKVGGIEQEKLFDRSEIASLVKDEAPKAAAEETAAKPAEKDKKDAASKHTGAMRVAILNFGAPSSWQGKYGDMVGVQVSIEGFKKAIPILEKAKTDIVVIRINSGGGYGLEARKFAEMFEKEYKPRFRTVMWVESAISAAAMSPWVLEEAYFMPQGNIGACTGWRGNLVAVKGPELEENLFWMEKLSDLGKRDRRIMRSMQITDPLSVDIDENGEVHWRQDEQGQYVVNKAGHIYTMTSSEAIKFKFARGIAADKDELARAMGLQEVEWVGQDATDLVDKSIRDNDAVEKHNQEVFEKYQLAISLAQQLQDKPRRGIQIAAAKRYLAELRKMVAVNPNFEFHLGIPPEWFVAQDELIKRLSQLP